VLSMPRPAITDAVTLQQPDGRVVFMLPWLEHFLIIGTTEVPHHDPARQPACTDAERDYLLAAVTEAFDLAVDADSVVWSWSGVRPLADDKTREVGRASRGAALDAARNGRGGSVTIYGGKITTYRRLAERVMDALAGLGASIGPSWTADAPLHGGTLSRSDLSGLALGASRVPYRIARRWVLTYGETTRELMRRIGEDPALGEEVVPGVPLVELEHAWMVEDARTGEDFMERRTKLRLFLPEQDRKRVVRWFADCANGLSQYGNTSVCPQTVSSF